MESSLNFWSFKISHILGYECFLMWLIGLYLLIFFHPFIIIIWVLLIVLCKIDFFLCNRCSLSKVIKWNLNLKFHLMEFWFELFNVHMNEETTICYDFHSFKWWNIIFFLILIIFLAIWHPFLACWIITTPIWLNIKQLSNFTVLKNESLFN